MHQISLPDIPLDRMCQQAARDLQLYRSQFQGSWEARWRAWAGDHLDAMKNSAKATVAYLDDPDPALRLTAASLVAEYWLLSEPFALPCLHRAFADPDGMVRGAALTGLVYKVHPFLEEPSGRLTYLLDYLRTLEKIPEDFAVAARKQTQKYVDLAEEMGRNLCRQLAGPHLDEMMTSREAAEAYLKHPEGRLRRASILVLVTRWGRTSELNNQCKRLIHEDPETEGRVEALGALASTFCDTDDAEIGDLLARLVHDRSAPTILRRHAYDALFVLRGMPVERWLDATSADFRFPEDVDWPFVATFLREAEGTQG